MPRLSISTSPLLRSLARSCHPTPLAFRTVSQSPSHSMAPSVIPASSSSDTYRHHVTDSTPLVIPTLDSHSSPSSSSSSSSSSSRSSTIDWKGKGKSSALAPSPSTTGSPTSPSTGLATGATQKTAHTAEGSEIARKPARRPLQPRSKKAAITLTPTAIARLRALASSGKPNSLLRIGIRTKGCAGMAYHLEYADKPGRFDDVVEPEEGVKVLIDSKALMSIIGSEMDWVEDRLSAKFVFHNPNIVDACGCGESFNVAVTKP